jgi:hypothetical protein
MYVMSEKAEDSVVLRVEVSEDFRTRLKTQAVRRGVTMGEILEMHMDNTLRQLEAETLEKVKANKT